MKITQGLTHITKILILNTSVEVEQSHLILSLHSK